MTLVDVILPARNAEATLSSAVESILTQTFSEFKLFIIDDGSSDGTGAIAETYSRLDGRVVVVSLDGMGLPKALNDGIKRGCAPFIARMDADDVSYPERLQRQVKRLSLDCNLVVLGTAYARFGNKEGSVLPPLTDVDCRRALLSFNPFAHPTVMLRRTAVEAAGYYNECMPCAQDYDMFSRLALLGKVGNLPEVLLDYRVHSGQVTNVHGLQQLEISMGISASNLARSLGTESVTAASLIFATIKGIVKFRGKHLLPMLRQIAGVIRISLKLSRWRYKLVIAR
ncbi:glycosyltransferase [Roseibium sp.]|uniref:glycosyltransferase family 2 protein n=1 Tax=Roseibium sp. TaxID=1936156 RepID=UPI0032988E72